MRSYKKNRDIPMYVFYQNVKQNETEKVYFC